MDNWLMVWTELFGETLEYFLFIYLRLNLMGQHQTNPLIDFDSTLTYLSPLSLICHITSHL